MHCVEVLQDNDLQCFYDVGLVSIQTHLEFNVFLKDIFFVIFSFTKFYF